MLKTEAFGFQHLPRDLANVNAWKTMFDPYIKIRKSYHQAINLLSILGRQERMARFQGRAG